MFNKLNSKHLLIVFAVLLGMVLISLIGKNNKKNQSFKSELTDFDTATVTSVSIFPKSGGDLITLEKKNGRWMVVDKNGSYSADAFQIKNILGSISSMKAIRLAAKGKDRWQEFEVTDSLGTRVKVNSGKKTLADIYIGKFSYKQANGNPYMQRQQGTMTSFVRLSAEKNIYAVDGFLSMTFNRSVSEFRNRTISTIDKNSISRIQFSQPNDNFSIIKNGNIWMIDGLNADSISIANYISGISNLKSGNFLSKNNKPVGTPSHSVSFEFENQSKLVKIDAYYVDSLNIAIASSENPDTYFDGTKSELFNKIFKTKESFVGVAD
jgi:hypothetical protein